MPTVEEIISAQNGWLNPTLQQGLGTLSAQQTVTFTLYKKLVLPFDGFVFWIKADQLSQAALFNKSPLNDFLFDANSTVKTPALTIQVQGSVHYATDQKQLELETLSITSVVFTTSTQVQDFNEISPTMMYVGMVDNVRFAFNKQGMFYPQAGLYHYVGDSLYPSFASQLVDDVANFDAKSIVVSNSLPAWLTMNLIPSIFPYNPRPAFELYPSFAVADNIVPPYGVVHIPPSSTTPLQPIPSHNAIGSHYQLMVEDVEITLYGLRNNQAIDFMDYCLQFSERFDVFGIMAEGPSLSDEKSVQSELNILAMRKMLKFRVSYQQSRINQFTRQLITSCLPTYIVEANPVFNF